MTPHPLDRPVWSALTTRQVEFAVRVDRAARFAADVSPLAAVRDESPECLAALADLIPPAGRVMVLLDNPFVPPPGTAVARTIPIVRMVATALAGGASADGLQPLTEADAPEMLALATLTEPGPFLPRTHRLGAFWGIREHGRLVAMAGERLRPEGFTELSGVCAHPDVRGRGFARKLSAWVAHKIAARGETPFLHSIATNTNANRLYQSLGFTLWREVTAVVLRRD